MKKIMEGSFLLLLVCFSFFYTDQVIDIVNKNTPLMKSIEELSSSYETLPVNAILKDDTIIPGINGMEVDLEKSYDNMKDSGIFREEALIFKALYPSDSLSNNKDKYIIKGSNAKKEVAIIVIFSNKNIDKVNNIDNITLFINHNDLTINNISLVKDIEIYTYGNNGIYSEEILTNDNNLINRLSNNKSNYCLTKEKNNDVLEVCYQKRMYTVIPNITGGYYEVRSNLSNGSIILLDNLNDIEVITKYIKSKGYNIVTLNKLLSE